MQIDVVHPGELTSTRLERWAHLARLNPDLDSPFLGPGWARAVARACGDVGQIRVAVMRDGEEAVGFLPVRVGAFTAMPAGAPLCDYQALVAAPGVRLDPQALVRALDVHRFDFSHMIETDPVFARHARGRTPSFIIDLAKGYEAYAADRRAAGSSALKDLDKKRRRAEREGGEVLFTPFSRSRSDFDQLMVWKRAQMQTTGQTDVLGAGWVMRLLIDLFESRDPGFGGGLFTLHLEGRLAAAHFHLRGRHVLHGWLIAHDGELARYSPSLLLFQDILRWMGDTPYSQLDLGAGDYRFKRELANASRVVTHGFVGRPSPAAFVRLAEYELRRAAESLPLGRVSGLPGKAMRRLDIRRALR